MLNILYLNDVLVILLDFRLDVLELDDFIRIILAEVCVQSSFFVQSDLGFYCDLCIIEMALFELLLEFSKLEGIRIEEINARI